MIEQLEDQNQNPKIRGSRGSLFAFLNKNAVIENAEEVETH